jgi:hypothetical protein
MRLQARRLRMYIRGLKRRACLAQLLTYVGFTMPVVDVDRVEIGYASLDRLVSDLRAMGATNILSARAKRPMLRTEIEAARAEFLKGEDRATELVEILHFAAWKPV